MHTITRDYKRTEQSGEPHTHSNLSLVMASYSLQTTGSWLLWAVRVHHPDDLEKLWSRSTHGIATVCPSCSWPHIHTAVIPQQLLPIHKCSSHAHNHSIVNSSTVTCVWQWYKKISLIPRIPPSFLLQTVWKQGENLEDLIVCTTTYYAWFLMIEYHPCCLLAFLLLRGESGESASAMLLVSHFLQSLCLILKHANASLSPALSFMTIFRSNYVFQPQPQLF